MKNLLSMLCNIAIVVATVYAVRSTMRVRGERGEVRLSAETFRYFTTDSNILAALAALTVLPFNVIALAGGGFDLPVWALTTKYAGTSALAVTFLTVILFLGPTQGYDKMFVGTGLYMHLIGPLLAVFSFCLLETGDRVTGLLALIAWLPVFVYGVVYAYMVIVRGENNGGWEDFYGFNRNNQWLLSAVTMNASAFLVCEALRWLHNAA